MKVLHDNLPIPNPTPLLFAMAAVVSWSFLADASSVFRQAAIGTAIGVVLAAVLIAMWNRPMSAILLLVISGATARFYVQISGLKARPEHIAAAVIFLATPFWWNKVKDQPLWIRADSLLLLYIGMNFFSSRFMSVDPGQTVKWAAQQMLVILPYFFMRVIMFDRERLRQGLEILLTIGVVEAVYGLVCFYSNRLFNTDFGMEIDQYGYIPGTYGTHLEANILGSTSAACMLMLLTLYFRERRTKFLAGAAITYAAMAISLSRAAVLAAGFSLTVLVFYQWRQKLIDSDLLKKVVTTLLLTTLVLAPALVSLYSERFSTLQVSDVSADADTTVRVVTLATALDHVLDHPVLGNGTASFQLLSSYNDMGWGYMEEAPWIPNTEIRVLHDVGIIGLAVFALFLWYLFLPVLRMVRRDHAPELMALLIAALLYSITFQATEATLMGFSWVHLGFIGCAVSLLQREQSSGTQPGKVAGDRA